MDDDDGTYGGEHKRSAEGEPEGAPAKKKAKRHTPGQPRPWTPQDDIILRDAVQNSNDFLKITKNIRFSFGRPTPKELEDRWKTLLFDPVLGEYA